MFKPQPKHASKQQQMLGLNGNDVIDSDLKATINGNGSVTYIGVTFTRNGKKLRKRSTPAEVIRKFVEACVIHIILYC